MNKSLSGLKSFSEPIVKLIEAIEKATGILYEPKRIVRKAKAEAKSEIIKKIGSTISNDIDIRTITRVLNQENKRQINIDNIVYEAINQLKYSENEESIDDIEVDWVTDFFNFAQDISNEKLQKVWAKLLANEVDKPGSISRRTLFILKTISNKEAIMFNMLCANTIGIVETIDNYANRGMVVLPEEGHYKFNDEIWGIKDVEIGILQELRLCEYLQFFIEKGDEYIFEIGKQKFKIKPKKEMEIHFHALSHAGKELYGLTQFEQNSKYLDKCEDYLREINLIS